MRSICSHIQVGPERQCTIRSELINLFYFSGFDFQQSVQFETAAIPCGPTHPNVSVSLSLQGRGAVKVDNKYITYSPKVRADHK